MNKKRLTNVWKKAAYKCMKKTCIQMYEKNMRVEVFLGRSHDCGHCIGSLSSWGRRKKRMKTLGMRKKFWKFGQIFICIHTNVWQKHEYKIAYKCMTKTRIQMYEKNILIYWRTANYSTQGGWGALLKGTSAVTRRWTATPSAVCPPILLWSSEWRLNHLPSGYCTTTLPTAPWQTQIQM